MLNSHKHSCHTQHLQKHTHIQKLSCYHSIPESLKALRGLADYNIFMDFSPYLINSVCMCICICVSLCHQDGPRSDPSHGRGSVRGESGHLVPGDHLYRTGWGQIYLLVKESIYRPIHSPVVSWLKIIRETGQKPHLIWSCESALFKEKQLVVIVKSLELKRHPFALLFIYLRLSLLLCFSGEKTALVQHECHECLISHRPERLPHAAVQWVVGWKHTS